MVKNVVFDIGNVLATFKPKEVMEEFFQDEKAARDLYELFFASGLWNDYDQGLYNGHSLKQIAIEKMPMYQREILALIPGWAKYVRPIDSSLQMIKELKKQGYGIYILSNIPEDSYVYLKDQTSLFDDIDGGIFSYQVQVIKPDRRIYECLLEKYGLKSEECLFIDDRKENVEMALSLGFSGIHCQDPNDLKEEVRKVLYAL